MFAAIWMLTGRYRSRPTGGRRSSPGTCKRPRCRRRNPALFPVPRMLEETVLACLMKKPDERPDTARELCDRLSRCEVDQPWTREDAQRWWERRMEPHRKVRLEV